MTNDRAAALGRAEIHLTGLLNRAHPDPATTAAQVVRWLLNEGWRPVKALGDKAGPPHRARPEVQAAAKAEIDAALAERRKARR